MRGGSIILRIPEVPKNHSRWKAVSYIFNKCNITFRTCEFRSSILFHVVKTQDFSPKVGGLI